MAFTAQDVKTLRERTGVGMMDCKKALQEANGDMDKAAEILREKGIAAADKKAGRIAAEGVVYAVADNDSKVGVVVEVNSETDFVAKNEGFQQFVRDLAGVIMQHNPADVDALMDLKMGAATVADELRDKILVIGENLKIRRFHRFGGTNCAYVHGGGTHGVLVQFETSDEIAKNPAFEAFGKDIAMHIAAQNPTYLSREQVPAEVLEKEKEILKAQALNEGKPEAIAEKMVAGRVNKFYENNCLLDQDFVKDPDITVNQYVQNTAKELGGDIKIVNFARFEKGEGIEKRNDDFAAEVAGMVK
ncbi:translation elongation factor Ts [Ruminococcaceae bacterium OttesenSCG-928-A16]|nr:translation elongation factor Ts [Ruminococcaceae bacterium OttesenSCG-928-A16]